MVDRNTTERGGFTSFRDMFDGGGPGQSGARFEGGGLLSSIGNAFGGPRDSSGSFGYQTEGGDRVSALRDMIDGGGRGQAGQQFEGGLLSAILNALGVRPAGFQDVGDPQEAVDPMPQAGAPSLMASASTMRPMMRPQAPNAMVDAPMQPGMSYMPDGEAFLRQNIAAVPVINQPMMNMPQMMPAPGQMSAPMRPQGTSGRPMSPYDEMLERFRASGNPVMSTARGSLRPTGILGR
jgi:hypothetical protein